MDPIGSLCKDFRQLEYLYVGTRMVVKSNLIMVDGTNAFIRFKKFQDDRRLERGIKLHHQQCGSHNSFTGIRKPI